MRFQSASRCGDYPFLSNGNSHRRNRRGLDRSRRRCSIWQSHHAITRSLRPVLVYQWRKTNVAAGLAGAVWTEPDAVDVDSQEVNGDVLGVEWVFRVFTVVGVVVDAPHDESFRQRPEEQVLVRVRHCTVWNGVDLAVHGWYRILGCPFFQGFYVSHLNSRTQHSLACEQHCVYYMHLVGGC